MNERTKTFINYLLAKYRGNPIDSLPINVDILPNRLYQTMSIIENYLGFDLDMDDFDVLRRIVNN